MQIKEQRLTNGLMERSARLWRWLAVFSGLLALALVGSGCTAGGSGGTPTPPDSEMAAPTAAPSPIPPEESDPMVTLTVPATSEPVSPDGFRIIGYFRDTDTGADELPWTQLTHINYAFLFPNSDGSVSGVEHPETLRTLVAAAHGNGVQVLISVGGWGWDEQFEALAAEPERRARFVTAVSEFVAEYDLDGADIDWEYPDAGTASADHYTALMTELNAVLHPEGKLLTAAVAASNWNGDGVSAEVFPLVDFLNVMAYDGPGLNHASMEFAVGALDYWSARGLPAEKTVLGVPFYARPLEVIYRDLVALDPTAAQADEWDYQGTRVYYNGLPMIREKTAMALRRASGIMIWALQYDTRDETSLLGAIARTATRDLP